MLSGEGHDPFFGELFCWSDFADKAYQLKLSNFFYRNKVLPDDTALPCYLYKE